MPANFTLRTIAILLLAAGYGWAGGHFIPADSPLWAYLFQFVMLILLMIFAIGFLRSQGSREEAHPRRRNINVTALSIFAALTLIVNVVNVIRGATNAGQFGSHNNFADLVPIGLIIIGDVIWLTTIASGIL
jgi:NADH:ubiquinone oxidoreductase subunit 6 (subunit J)